MDYLNETEFWDEIETIGELREKHPQSSSSSNADPLIRMRENFAYQVKKQIDMLKGVTAVCKNKWYTERENGTLSCTLRNGNKTLTLRDKSMHCDVTSTSKAIAFYQKTAAACANGLFDEKLKATRRVVKKKADSPTEASSSVSQ